MIKSRNSECVYWFPEGSLYDGGTILGGWYYFDEAGLISDLDKPYKSESDAIAALSTYAAWLHGEEEGGRK